MFFGSCFSLAVADSMLIVELVVEKAVIYHHRTIHQAEPMWYIQTYPYFWHPMKGMFMAATIFMIVAVSAERYRATCHPFSKQHVSLYFYAMK